MKKHVLFLILPFLLTSCSVKKVEQTENMEENVDYNKEEMLIYQGETKIYGNLFSPLEFNKDTKFIQDEDSKYSAFFNTIASRII